MNNLESYLNLILTRIGNISTVTMIIPIIVALIKMEYLNKILKILFTFCVLRFLISLILQFLIWAINNYKSFFIPILNKFDIHNMNFMAIFSHSNNFALLGLYFSLIIENKKIAFFIKGISIVLFIVAIVNYLFIEGYKTHNVFNSTASNLFCLVLPMFHLWYIYNEDPKVPINKNPYFWISLGLLVPNLLGFITSIIGKKLSETDLVMYRGVEIVYGVVQILGYLLIALGFYYARYTKYLPQNTPSVK